MISQFSKKVEVLLADDAKEYNLAKNKEDQLMEHYEIIFKRSKQNLTASKSWTERRVVLGKLWPKQLLPNKLVN